jgi:hypothetical protein
MSNEQIHARIEEMVEEERKLWERESAGQAGPEDRVKLEELKIHLDQAWDLLRQRRGLSEAGFDENDAHIRDEGTVENYKQ